MLDINTLAAWGEFIGGIAVVVSLIYLAGQIRQNSKIAKATTTQALIGASVMSNAQQAGDVSATWEAPAYDMDNTWTSTWWAQVLPGHSKLSVCRRLWQSNALTVTAAINVSNTVDDLVAFSGASVDLSDGSSLLGRNA